MRFIHVCGPGRLGQPVSVLRETRHCLDQIGERNVRYLLGIPHTNLYQSAKVKLMETANCSDFIQWPHE